MDPMTLPTAVRLVNELEAALNNLVGECDETLLEQLTGQRNETCRDYFARAYGLVEVIRRVTLPRIAAGEIEQAVWLTRVVGDVMAQAPTVIDDARGNNAIRAAFAAATQSAADLTDLAKRAGAVIEKASGGIGVGIGIALVLFAYFYFGGKK